jgi:uncharacterized BrkB/YihY/UPF0761 family membrane protein
VVESLEREVAAGSGLLAGGVAYRLFLWIVPFGLVIAGIASFWARSDSGSLQRAAKDFGIAGAAARSAASAFRSEAHGRWYFLVAGMILLFWFGISAVRSLRIAHAIAWAVRPPKMRNPLGASFLFTVVVVSVTFLGAGTRWVRHNFGEGAGLAVTLAMLLVYVSTAVGVTLLLPHGNAPWTALLPGALVISIGMELVHLWVVLYIAPRLDRSPELYGTLGAATVFLLWLYVIARLIVSAAFLNATIWDRKQRA